MHVKLHNLSQLEKNIRLVQLVKSQKFGSEILKSVENIALQSLQILFLFHIVLRMEIVAVDIFKAISPHVLAFRDQIVQFY